MSKEQMIMHNLDILAERTKVEKEAEELFCQGKYKEGIELLDTLDDNAFVGRS